MKPHTPPLKKYFGLVLFAWLILLQAALDAAPIVDNNEGTWTDSFNDELGTFSLSNISVDVFAGTTSLDSGQTNGSQTSVIITPPSFDAWDKLCLDASYGTSDALDITLLDPNNGDAPITGFVDLDLSNFDTEGCLDISGLDAATYPEIRVRVDHKRGATAPVVREMMVTWNPQTVLLFDKKTVETIPAGVQFPYQVRLSTNFVNAQNVIVWDTLPMNGRGIDYPTDYGQTDEPIIGQISEGGIFTADGTTDAATGDPLPSFPDGMTSFPVNSVVWYFDEIEAGNSLVLQLFVEAPNGTLNTTVYKNNANVHVDNGEDKVAKEVETIITSEPAPNMTKAGATLASPGVTRVFGLNGENYVIARNSPGVSDTLTFRIRDPFGPVDGNDYDEQNRSRMYNTVIYDDLSGLIDPNGDGDTSDSYLLNPSNPAHSLTATKFNADGTTTSIPATFTSTATTVHTTDVPAQSVYWDFGTLEVGDGYQIEFKVDLASDIPQLTEFTNTAGLDSDQTELLTDELPMIVDVPIGGCFCKFGYFPHYLPKEQDVPCGLDIDGVVPVVAGDPVEYRLYNTNCGVIELNDVVYFDRIPAEVEFVSASLHNRRSKEDITTAEGATVWFYVGSDPAYDDPEVHPPFDYSVLPGGTPADWSQTQPATVTWVAVHHPSMPSFIDFPDDAGSRVYAAFNTTVSQPADPCDEFWIENWGHAKVYRKTDGTLQTLAEPFAYKNDDLTRVKPPQGEFFIDSEAASVTPVTVIPGVAEYSLTVRNESADSGLVGLDAFSDVTVDLQLTPVSVNGVPTYPSIQGVNGGTITNFDPINGNVTLQLGRQLSPGEEATINMELGFPNGTENLSVYTVAANLTGFDDLCSPFEASIQTSGIVSGTPLLQANKDDVLNVIGTGDEVTYEVNYRNVGTATSVNSWVADRIPFRTTFVDATAPNGEEVWFTDKLPPSMPANQISVLNPVDFSVISANFSPGIQDDNGTPSDPSDDTWTSPFGDQTTWIAYKVDNPTLSPPQLEVSAAYKTVTFTVVNDDNGTTAGTDGSPEGTVIFNELVIFSDTNLQAVGNEVRTTVESFPGLQISKSSNKELVTAGERFRWNVDFINNSGFTDDIVTITDYLPKDVVLRGLELEWNDGAVANGQTAGVIDIIADPNVTITNNADGSTTVEVLVAGSPGLKSDLLTGEGGRLSFIVRSLSTTASGTESINTVQGFASNARSSVVVSDSDPITIANPDLTLSKIASTTEPKNGDRITFTLLVANRGLNEASDVVITDTLPAGMTFVEGSTQMLTPGYAILDDPAGGDSVLTWTSLTQDGGAMGTLPGQSADVFISYQVDVAGAAGDTLTNVAEVTTSDVEDNEYGNTDEQEVVLPFPDPKITKSAVSVAQAGETVVWTISYSNGTNNEAPDVYIIDAIPAGLAFNSVLLPSGVTAYYSDAVSAPTFTPGTSGAGWSSSPPATVTFIAFEVGTLAPNAGDADILVSTSIPGGAAPGTAYTNTATISTSARESDDPEEPTDGPDNNVATAMTQIPGVDMAIAKSASAEGSVPGLRPGDPITYTLELTNTGTQTAYGVKVEDVLPANFVPHPTAFNGFATVEATDDDGASVTLEDAVGAPVTFPVSATLDDLSPAGGDTVTWYLGTTANSGDADYYRNIGIPVGAIVTFTYQGFVSDTAADGDTVSNATTLIVDNQSDADPAEDFLSNNTDEVSTRVYRPEVSVAKSVVNESDQDETWTEAGEVLTYEIEYNNTGNADADDVVISEIIPVGTSYVPGSLELPAGAGVVWSPNAEDPESFEVQFDSLPAPATFDGIPGYGTGTENDPFTDLVALGGVPTGTYWFRIGGLSFQGYVDGDTAGGGWLMVLNYVHQGGTNPELEVRSTNLPLFSSDSLGDDESGSENWGHLSNSLAAALDFDTLRFYGKTTAHSRLLHFRTTDDFQIGTDYVKTGTGSFNTLNGDGTWLAIPGQNVVGPVLSTSELSNQGDYALTARPFFDSGDANWAIRHNGDDWEVDEVVGDESESTIHRVFVRKEPLGSAGQVLCLEPRALVEVESVLSEVSAIDAGYDGHVSFDTDSDNDGGGGTDDPAHTRAQQSTYHAIGDVNGDGIVDYVVGSPFRDLDEANEMDLDNVNLGSVIVNLMNADGTVASTIELGNGTAAANGHLSGLAAFDLFGFSVEPIGDADGDGVPDIAVGAYGTNVVGNNRGSVYFLYLNNDGTLKGVSQIVSGSAGLVTANGLTAADNETSQGIGRSLTYIEDFAGSGDSVLVTGDVNLDGNGTNSGGYYMMWLERDGSGNLTGNVTQFIKMQDGRDPLLTGVIDTSDLFGYDVEFVGDIDGNGAEDLLVGAAADDDGGLNRGAAYLLLLETTGEIANVVKYSSISSSPIALDDSDNMGYGVAVIGDLDGDGINEFAISAANDDDYSAGSGSSSNLGATYVIFPNADGSIREYQKLSSTENNGYLFLAGQNGGQRMNSYDVDDDGINELFYGTQTNIGVLYSTGASNPSYTYPGGVPTPTFGTVSQGTQADDPGVIVLKLRSGLNANATSVTEDFPISADGTLTSWDKLLVNADADDAVTITYELLDSGGSTTLFGPMELEDGFADISDIDVANSDMILRVTMTSTDETASACLQSWRATYVVEEVPSFTFQVTVDDPAPAGQSTVDNTVSIATSTPEIDDNTANNTAEDSINIRLTDLLVTKVVDTGAVKEGASETINYDVAWEVLGPQGAINAVVTDVLPANTTYVSSSGSPTVDNNYQGSGLTALIWNLGDQPTGASGVFTVQVTETGGLAGDSLNNVVTIANDRQETDYDNNDDNALTVITDANGLANVWIEKVSDTPVVDLYGGGSFTITYGNNGNGDAANVMISDTLPNGLVIQSATPGTLGSANDFSYNAGTLAPGATGSITVAFTVDQAYMTSNWQETQVNIANISTSSPETDLGDNSDPAEVDVILEQLASLSGTVYHDDDRTDGDAGADNLGNLDLTEAGIPGVTITLTGTDIFGNDVNLTTVTDEDGNYSFAGINPGTYDVIETQPEGWFSTTTDAGDIVDTTASPSSTTADQGTTGSDTITGITLAGGERGVDYNFGEDLATLGDMVWIDGNGDGIQDPGEAGVPGVTVRVYDANTDTVVGVTSTDAQGNYLFDDLLAGDYYVEFDYSTLPYGYGPTEQNADGDDKVSDTNTDSDADVITGRTQTVTLAAGDTDTDLDLGLVGPPVGTIGNYIWHDEDSNGYQDDGELGLANVKVDLYDGDGNVVATTYTDADGGYLFTDLPAGEYFVNVDEATLPTGFTQSPLTNAGGDFGNQDDSDDPGAGDYGYPVLLGGTEPMDNSTADFGYNINPAGEVNDPTATAGAETAALGDFIWIDADGDGIQDDGEAPVSGVEVTLYNDHDGDGVYDNPVGTTTTDSNGRYYFDGLVPDAYVVEVTDSASASHDILGSDYLQTGDPDHFAETDTAASANDGKSEPIVLAPGDVFLNADFGYQPEPTAPLGSIGDVVWNDLNGDGVEDAGEPGIGGVTVSLIDDLDGDGVWDVGEPIINTTTTASDGSYLFDNLPYDDYIVWVNDTDGVLNGLDQTYDADGVAGTPNVSATTIDAGTPDVDDQDFGYTSGEALGSIGDTIWGDLDNSGGDQSTQGNEPGLANVTVNLYPDDDEDGLADDVNGDGLVDANDIIAIAVTDSNGNYLFDGLSLGGYVVEVDTATLPAGYQATATHDSDGNNDSSSPVLLTDAAPDNRAQDFSYPTDGTLGAIGDTIWADDDANGSQNGGEQGIPGITVELYDATGTTLIATTVTDSNGNYLFPDLPLGDYTVVVDTATLPDGYDAVPTGDPENDGDSSSSVTVSGGAPVNQDQDFGFPPATPGEPVGSIGDTIYADLDGNGTQDTNEPGLAGVTVTLTDGTTTWTTVTDENGNYNFPNLDPDPAISYTVQVDTSTLPPEYNPVPTESGSDGGTDDSSTLSLDTTDAATRNDDAQDFGFQPATETGSIGNYVWLDSDGGGDQNESGTGLPGVVVELYDEQGELIAVTETGPDGSYYFGGLPLDDGSGAAGADYTVKIADSNFDPGGVLEGLDNTFDNDGGLDSESVVTLTSGAPDNVDQDFGYVSTDGGSIGTTVWNDVDGDGVLDGGESGIEGVTVVLYRDVDGDGIVGPGEPAVGTTTTDASGEYLFDGLPFDDYIVVVTDENSVLDGYWHSEGPSPGTDGNSQEDSGYPVTINSGNPDDTTADFGYYKDPAAIGNYVWLDADGDGVQESGESAIEGAVVTLTITYPDGTEVTVTDVTDANGHYSFGNLLLDEDYNTGSGGAQPTYELAVQTPADTVPTVIGSGDATSLTDSNDPAGTPAIPVQGETGTDQQADPSSEPAVAGYDFGFTSPKDNTYAGWQDNWDTELDHTSDPGTNDGPSSNPDGDMYSNALEYALCLNPGSGLPGYGEFCLTKDPATGVVSAQFMRRRGGLLDVTYTLQGADTLGTPTAWTDITSISPVLNTTDADVPAEAEKVTYTNLQNATELSNGTASGIVRLCVEIDGTNYYTEAFGWQCVGYNDYECATFSSPFSEKPTLSGTFPAVGALTLSTDPDGNVTFDVSDSAGGADLSSVVGSNGSHYLQITSGPLEGERFDILSGGVSSITLVNDPDIFSESDGVDSLSTSSGIPADSFLNGASFQVIRYQTVADLFDMDSTYAGLEVTDPNQATRLLFYNSRLDTPTFEILMLIDTVPAPVWTRSMVTLDDDSGYRIDPAMGNWIHPKASGDALNPGSPVEQISYGMIASHDQAVAVNEGFNLAGAMWPYDQTPAGSNGRDYTVLDGFDGGIDPVQSSELLFWNGDFVVDVSGATYSEGYDNYMLLDGGGMQNWVDINDIFLADQDELLILESHRAVMLKLLQGDEKEPHIYTLPNFQLDN